MIKNLLTIILTISSLTLLGQVKEGVPPTPTNQIKSISDVVRPNPNEKNIGNDNSVLTFTTPDGTVSEILRTSIDDCAFVEARERQLAASPQLGTDEDFEVWIKQKIEEQRILESLSALSGPRCDVMYIPYVVHVMHPDEPVNTIGNATGVNISASQVESLINQVNIDFRKLNLERDNPDIWDDS